MKKVIKSLLKVFVSVSTFIFILTAGVFAEDFGGENELYKRQFEVSGAGELNSNLPKGTSAILEEFGIDPSNPESIFSPDTQNIFSIISEFLTGGIKAPLKAALSIVGIILILSSVNGLIVTTAPNGISIFICFVASMLTLEPIYSLMGSVSQAVKSLSSFMLSFVPIYSGIMLSGGKTATAGGFSTLLLGAAETVTYIISYFFVPIAGGAMCLGICGGISPVSGLSRLSEWIKKSANWAMGITTTLFLSILSIQNTVAAASDTVGMRTSKAVISTTIPVMGPAIAETLNTAKSCLSLLRSGVGIYAVAAILVIALPIITELILWRFSMWITSAVAEMFGLPCAVSLFRSVDFALSILLGAVLFTALLFIISLAISI